jgi:hypothetical protein
VKKFITLFIVALLFLLVGTSVFATIDKDMYVRVIEESLRASLVRPNIIDGWRTGLIREHGIKLDRLETIFTLKTITPNADETACMITGTVATIAYGYKEANRVRFIRTIAIICVIDTKGTVLYVTWTTIDIEILNGWSGQEC